LDLISCLTFGAEAVFSTNTSRADQVLVGTVSIGIA
jgi:hypothetical protein